MPWMSYFRAWNWYVGIVHDGLLRHWPLKIGQPSLHKLNFLLVDRLNLGRFLAMVGQTIFIIMVYCVYKRRRRQQTSRDRGQDNILGISLYGLNAVSGRNSLGLMKLWGQSNRQGSTSHKNMSFHPRKAVSWGLPSPSMIANLSWAMLKPPSLLTSEIFGCDGTWKNWPGG
jgi:hypothetical protein